MNHDTGRHVMLRPRCPVCASASGSASRKRDPRIREESHSVSLASLGIVTQCSRPCRAAAYDCATCFEAAGCCCCCWRGSPAWYPACRPRGRRARCQGHASRATLSSIPEKRSHPGPPRHRTQGGRRPSAASAAARSRGRRGGPRGSPSAPTAPGPRARPASGS